MYVGCMYNLVISILVNKAWEGGELKNCEWESCEWENCERENCELRMVELRMDLSFCVSNYWFEIRESCEWWSWER
jgi:hypothetical protein